MGARETASVLINYFTLKFYSGEIPFEPRSKTPSSPPKVADEAGNLRREINNLDEELLQFAIMQSSEFGDQYTRLDLRQPLLAEGSDPAKIQTTHTELLTQALLANPSTQGHGFALSQLLRKRELLVAKLRQQGVDIEAPSSHEFWDAQLQKAKEVLKYCDSIFLYAGNYKGFFSHHPIGSIERQEDYIRYLAFYVQQFRVKKRAGDQNHKQLAELNLFEGRLVDALQHLKNLNREHSLPSHDELGALAEQLRQQLHRFNQYHPQAIVQYDIERHRYLMNAIFEASDDVAPQLKTAVMTVFDAPSDYDIAALQDASSQIRYQIFPEMIALFERLQKNYTPEYVFKQGWLNAQQWQQLSKLAWMQPLELASELLPKHPLFLAEGEAFFQDAPRDQASVLEVLKACPHVNDADLSRRQQREAKIIRYAQEVKYLRAAIQALRARQQSTELLEQRFSRYQTDLVDEIQWYKSTYINPRREREQYMAFARGEAISDDPGLAYSFGQTRSSVSLMNQRLSSKGCLGSKDSMPKPRLERSNSLPRTRDEKAQAQQRLNRRQKLTRSLTYIFTFSFLRRKPQDKKEAPFVSAKGSTTPNGKKSQSRQNEQVTPRMRPRSLSFSDA